MKATTAQTYIFSREFRTKMTYTFFVLSAFMIGLYALNVYSLISKTVALKDTASSSDLLSGSVQQLDVHYLELVRSITPDSLRDHGLSQGSVSAYIPLNPSLGRLATDGHGI